MFSQILVRRSLSIVQQIQTNLSSQPVKFDLNLQKKIEHLSLLSFQNDQTIKKVEQTIHSSDIIHQINVNHLEPLYTLIETDSYPLRQSDTVSIEKTLPIKQVLQNASITYEDYFVAPIIGKRDSQTVEKVDQTEL